jgi:hypothetical protein
MRCIYWRTLNISEVNYWIIYLIDRQGMILKDVVREMEKN